MPFLKVYCFKLYQHFTYLWYLSCKLSKHQGACHLKEHWILWYTLVVVISICLYLSCLSPVNWLRCLLQEAEWGTLLQLLSWLRVAPWPPAPWSELPSQAAPPPTPPGLPGTVQVVVTPVHPKLLIPSFSCRVGSFSFLKHMSLSAAVSVKVPPRGQRPSMGRVPSSGAWWWYCCSLPQGTSSSPSLPWACYVLAMAWRALSFSLAHSQSYWLKLFWPSQYWIAMKSYHSPLTGDISYSVCDNVAQWYSAHGCNGHRFMPHSWPRGIALLSPKWDYMVSVA